MFKNISAVSSDNAAFSCDDEENQFLPNEEEVYQDLVKIQNNIARNQVFYLFIFMHSASIKSAFKLFNLSS